MTKKKLADLKVGDQCPSKGCWALIYHISNSGNECVCGQGHVCRLR